MKKIRLILLWCLIIGTLVSCNNDGKDDPTPEAALDYLPVTAGSTWNYGGPQPYSVTALSTTKEINGKTFREMENKQGNTVTKSFFSKQGGEYTGIGFVSGTGTMEVTFLKENVAVGTSWEQTFVINGVNSTYKSKLVATGLTKTVSGKEYKDVAQVQMESRFEVMGIEIDGPTANYFFAKGVGLILSDLGSQHQYPLLNYTIK